jgi:hypothetical protein
MEMDTYRSTIDTGVFVTLQSVAAATTIPLLDELVALRLDPFRCHYAFGEETRDRAFVTFVLTEIIRQGYAVHGLDPAFSGARPQRAAAESTEGFSRSHVIARRTRS